MGVMPIEQHYGSRSIRRTPGTERGRLIVRLPQDDGRG